MDRRDFLKKSGAVVAGGLVAELGILEQAASAAAKIERRPNIVFILVDEMRFPTVFPQGVSTPEQFLARYMPNVFELWRHGVKFERYPGLEQDELGIWRAPGGARVAWFKDPDGNTLSVSQHD